MLEMRSIDPYAAPGRSTGSCRSAIAGEVGTAARLAAEVSTLMDRLEIPRAPLVGHSLGGWIALELAASGRADAVVALAPALWESPRQASYTVRQLRPLAALRGRGTALGRLAATTIGRRLLLSRVSAAPRRIPAAAAARMVRDAVDAPGFGPTLDEMRRHCFERWTQVDVPVTVVWGDAERVVLRRTAEPLAARMLPRSRSVALESCGHLLMWDQPDAVAAAILAGPMRA